MSPAFPEKCMTNKFNGKSFFCINLWDTAMPCPHLWYERVNVLVQTYWHFVLLHGCQIHMDLRFPDKGQVQKSASDSILTDKIYYSSKDNLASVPAIFY